MSLDRATIITLGSALPPAVGIFGRLEALLSSPDTGLDEIIDLVRVDPALTFQIIRLGNSAFYGLNNRCDSLEQAVARIGFGDIHSLVGLVAARHACQQDLRAYQVSARQFWENAVATGQLMTALATVSGADPRNAYATGLLRNLGRIVLNNYAGAVRYPGADIAADLVAWERKTYGVTAAEVGAVLLEHWRFSPDTVAAVRGHVDAAAPAAPAALLHAAGGLAESWGYGLPGEAVIWSRDAAVLARAGLTEELCVSASALARTAYERIAGIQWEQAA
jgi:HD-like signal output (HDOD) protein